MSRQIEASRDALTRGYRWLAATRQRSPASRAPMDHDGPRPRHIVEGLLRSLVVSIERDQPGTRGHAERVAALSQRLALVLGLPPAEAELVGQAGMLHDIGKVEVASAAGPDELEPMGRHPITGAQLVAPFDFLAPAAPMIRHHHERVDGSGYPDGLRGVTIPVGARIIAVADEYDRLTAGVPPPARARGAALAHLARQAGRTLDSTVVSALLDLPLP